MAVLAIVSFGMCLIYMQERQGVRDRLTQLNSLQNQMERDQRMELQMLSALQTSMLAGQDGFDKQSKTLNSVASDLKDLCLRTADLVKADAAEAHAHEAHRNATLSLEVAKLKHETCMSNQRLAENDEAIHAMLGSAAKALKGELEEKQAHLKELRAKVTTKPTSVATTKTPTTTTAKPTKPAATRAQETKRPVTKQSVDVENQEKEEADTS